MSSFVTAASLSFVARTDRHLTYKNDLFSYVVSCSMWLVSYERAQNRTQLVVEHRPLGVVDDKYIYGVKCTK